MYIFHTWISLDAMSDLCATCKIIVQRYFGYENFGDLTLLFAKEGNHYTVRKRGHRHDDDIVLPEQF